MTTITITKPTNKSGQVAYFTIQFKVADFDAVIDAVEKCTITELYTSNLWKVI